MRTRIICAPVIAFLLLAALPAACVKLSAKIRVGNGPYSPALNSNTRRLYIANGSDSTVSVIDTSIPALLVNVPVSSGASALAVNPVTNLIYVNGDYSSKKVTVLNGADNSIVGTIGVGQGGGGIAVNPITNRIYAVNNFDSTVSVIDGATNTVTETIAVGSETRHVVVDTAANLVYVGDLTSVYVIDGSTDAVVNSVNVSHDITGMALDTSRQRLYVTDDVVVMVIAIDTTNMTVAQSLSTFESVFSLALNPVNHAILVPMDSNYTKDAIGVVNPNTFRLVGLIGQKTGGIYTDVVVDPATGYFYATALSNALYVFAP